MAKFPSLGANATVPDILKMSPEAGVALLEMHEAIMRAPSLLTPGQRELIAAYVSGLNRCQYCHGVHAETAKAYEDIPRQAVDRMFDDLETAGFDDKIKPILRLARKLTQTPAPPGSTWCCAASVRRRERRARTRWRKICSSVGRCKSTPRRR
jgi:uncharacterized peroxidase-related enzyme